MKGGVIIRWLKLRAGKPAIFWGVYRLSETMGFEAEGRERYPHFYNSDG